MGILGLKKARARRDLSRLLGGAAPPMFSPLTLRILEQLRDPEVAFEDVSEAIQWDPALTLKLLATVNSAAYSPRTRIEDVKHAISYVGRAQLENLVLAVAARSALPEPKLAGFDSQRFWETAAQRAALSRRFAAKLHPAREGEAFTAGLLLDLAVPVQAAHLGEPYIKILGEWHASGDACLADLERDRIGHTHTEVGGLLAQSWELPETLARLIACHHDRDASDKDLLPSIRLVADIREAPVPGSEESIIESARVDYGLDPDWTRDAMVSSEADASELARTISCA